MYSIYERKGFLVVGIYLHFNSMVGLCPRNQEYAGLSIWERLLPCKSPSENAVTNSHPSVLLNRVNCNGFSLYLWTSKTELNT